MGEFLAAINTVEYLGTVGNGGVTVTKNITRKFIGLRCSGGGIRDHFNVAVRRASVSGVVSTILRVGSRRVSRLTTRVGDDTDSFATSRREFMGSYGLVYILGECFRRGGCTKVTITY